jgi:hypothetical protein
VPDELGTLAPLLTALPRRKAQGMHLGDEAGFGGVSPKSCCLSNSARLRENRAQDTLHLANALLFGRSVVHRSHGAKQ